LVAAIGIFIYQTRRQNIALFDELARVTEAFATNDIEAIPLKGLLLRLFENLHLGRRAFRNLEFLIRDREFVATITALRSMG
jgi:hypothetical protein